MANAATTASIAPNLAFLPNTVLPLQYAFEHRAFDGGSLHDLRMVLKVKARLSLGWTFVARRFGRDEEGQKALQLVAVPEPYFEPSTLTGGPYAGPKPEGFLDPA